MDPGVVPKYGDLFSFGYSCHLFQEVDSILACEVLLLNAEDQLTFFGDGCHDYSLFINFWRLWYLNIHLR